MAAEFSRSRRVGELIQRELATLLSREVKDPRLALISITAVDVSRDLSLAKVFYTIMDIDQDAENNKLAIVKEGLKKATGFLRYELGHRIQLRIVPNLEFRYDESVIHGAQLSQLIDSVIEEDNKRHNSDHDID
ncbi:MAG: 30S ribosome-binding factor RbfA [gamma proteobacterium symbiont of Taylorina sp.]|nr:30S ribosome-binding factor RbfA [gamma proteobacterium symbiont of Taylorina sp.]